jgi:deoxyribonuclease V
MEWKALHRWDVSPAEASQIQEKLGEQLVLSDDTRLANLQSVAGVDNAYARQPADTIAYAAVVVLSFPKLEVVEERVAFRKVDFPYIPGLLSFREGLAILEACRQVESEVDLFFFDAHGYAHPRNFGLASHLGLLLDRPAIGCAKSRLTGSYQQPGQSFGDRQPLLDAQGHLIGMVVRTRPGHSPLFVSPGHKISLETAVALALACCKEGRFLPEPTRLAHNRATHAARK